MTWAQTRRFTLGLCLMLAAAAFNLAQAPDCTDISDVSDFDGATVSDFSNCVLTGAACSSNANCPTVGDSCRQLLTTVRIASGLSRPMFVNSPPGDLDRLFITQQDGIIKLLKNGVLTDFLNISAIVRSPNDGGNNEEGLLGLAFHPDYATNGYYFVYYTDLASNNIVARYQHDPINPDLGDYDPPGAPTTTRQTIISFAHPGAGNHNGGMIAFREQDGYLYIAPGDGGSGCDPGDDAQLTTSNLGKMLRIDPSTADPPVPPYTNPLDNPYVGIAGNDEIWSLGLRNPWRFSFDRITQNIYIGDVGQDVPYEEINCKPASSTGNENYGWNRYEGKHCPNPSCGSTGSCVIPNGVAPIWEYTTGRAVVGGYVYRGCRMSDLHGTYFFGDHTLAAGANIWSFRTDAACTITPLITRAPDLDPDGAGGLSIAQLTSLGEDERGELYFADRAGEVFKLLPVLSIMEVSGRNAAPILFDANDDMNWEDLQASSSHPIVNYKVYRSDGIPTGPFDCVHQGPTTVWVGGDPDMPLDEQVFYYLVTALNAAGEETRPGNQSDGTPRVVNTASVCP